MMTDKCDDASDGGAIKNAIDKTLSKRATKKRWPYLAKANESPMTRIQASLDDKSETSRMTKSASRLTDMMDENVNDDRRTIWIDSVTFSLDDGSNDNRQIDVYNARLHYSLQLCMVSWLQRECDKKGNQS